MSAIVAVDVVKSIHNDQSPSLCASEPFSRSVKQIRELLSKCVYIIAR